MDFKKLTNQAKAAIDKRGGTEALKGDLAELKGVATGKGTMKEKAKIAAEKLKQPGGPTTPETPPSTQDLPPRA